MKNFFTYIAEGFLQIIYPPLCIGCRQIITDKTAVQNICPSCLTNIQAPTEKFIQNKILLRLRPPFLTDITILSEFNSEIQNIIHHIKYQNMKHTAHAFAANLQDRLPSRFQQIDYIIPIPLHSGRRKERGYNQSLLLAQGFFGENSERIKPHLLIRSKATQSQTRLNREERKKNVWQAFYLRDATAVKNKKCLLVDDVVTTGATMNECARILTENGCAAVFGLALASPTDLDNT